MESSEQIGYTYLRKFTVAVFGDSGVGKSSIVRNLIGEGYKQEHIPTVEDFYVKQMTHRNKAYEIHIIDTSGTYEFPAMRRVAIQKADAAVLVYSLDKLDSFKKLERYMEEIESCYNDRNNNNRMIPIIIVSNKVDLPKFAEPTFFNARGLKVSTSDYVESKWKCQWFTTSARFNLNVAAIFRKLLDILCPEKKVLRGSFLRQKLAWFILLGGGLFCDKNLWTNQKCRLNTDSIEC